MEAYKCARKANAEFERVTIQAEVLEAWATCARAARNVKTAGSAATRPCHVPMTERSGVHHVARLAALAHDTPHASSPPHRGAPATHSRSLNSTPRHAPPMVRQMETLGEALRYAAVVAAVCCSALA